MHKSYRESATRAFDKFLPTACAHATSCGVGRGEFADVWKIRYGRGTFKLIACAGKLDGTYRKYGSDTVHEINFPKKVTGRDIVDWLESHYRKKASAPKREARGRRKVNGLRA